MDNRVPGRRENGFKTGKTLTLRPSKPKAWSHQEDLTAAYGKPIVLELLDGTLVNGNLVSADQFSLKVSKQDSAYFTVYYKSSLTSYSVQA